jgi:hypothetical protein
MTSKQMSFPETVSDSSCRNSSVVQTHSFISCLVKKPDVEILGWHGDTWSVVLRPVDKFSKTTLGRLMVEKFTFNSLATALVDIPAVSMPIARSLKT